MPCLIVIVVVIIVDTLLALMVEVWTDYRNFSDCKSFQIVSTFSCISPFTFIKTLQFFEFHVHITFTRINFSRCYFERFFECARWFLAIRTFGNVVCVGNNVRRPDREVLSVNPISRFWTMTTTRTASQSTRLILTTNILMPQFDLGVVGKDVRRTDR
jgi:hypothetical protein